MQTFMPYSDFKKSAACLDNKRLGKQRVEVLTILRILSGQVSSWKNHPAVLMWKGWTNLLATYGLYMCEEWIRRGFKDTCYSKIEDFITPSGGSEIKRIPWMGNEAFHASHRSNLLRKNYEFYKKYNWSEPDNLPYYWPVRK